MLGLFKHVQPIDKLKHCKVIGPLFFVHEGVPLIQQDLLRTLSLNLSYLNAPHCSLIGHAYQKPLPSRDATKL